MLNPSGLCMCGCGLHAPTCDRNDTRRGYVMGEPHCYVRGHRLRPGTKRSAYRSIRDQREHVVVAERALGHSLPRKSVVHHVNGDGRDNRSENLVICQDAAYHMLLHQRQRALDACGHAHWRKCWLCKEYDSPEALHKCGSVIRHPACAADYQRRLTAQRSA